MMVIWKKQLEYYGVNNSSIGWSRPWHPPHRSDRAGIYTAYSCIDVQGISRSYWYSCCLPIIGSSSRLNSVWHDGRTGSKRNLTITAALISLCGILGATLGILINSVFGFGVGITIAGFGVVLFTLTALSILPETVATTGLAKANAAIEIPRAICSFVVPLTIGLIITRIPAVWIFTIAGTGATLALAFAIALPKFKIRQYQPKPIVPQILEGGAYVLRHNLLLPISLCAILWNLAFAALLVVLVPTIQAVYYFDPGVFGIALSAFGLAAVAGSSVAGKFANSIAPSIILLFGPGSSLIAAISMTAIDADNSEYLLYACFFLLGFGPSMWLIAQNSVRQLVTPPTMLGRVNAVIQTSIYGIRPLGALIGGTIVGAMGPESGMTFVVLAFAASFAVSVFSPLRSVRDYSTLQNLATH